MQKTLIVAVFGAIFILCVGAQMSSMHHPLHHIHHYSDV
jgi:hypothetical protein